MIDLRLLRDDPDAVRASQRVRGESESVVDELLRADEERRAAVQAFETLRAEQKVLGKQVSQAKGDEKTALLARTKELSAEVKVAETAASRAETALRMAQLAVPNLVEEGAPPGGEDDFVVLREVGQKPDIDSPRDHLELGEGYARSIWNAAPRSPAAASTSSPAWARCWSSACSRWRSPRRWSTA
ncbi:hypothetical protein [Phytohabitans flavus]